MRSSPLKSLYSHRFDVVRLAAAFALVASAGACSGGDDNGGDTTDAINNPFIDAPPGTGPDARVIPIDATPLPDGPMDEGGPIVEFLSPIEPAPGDFSAGAILTNPRFTVRCRVSENPSTPDLIDSSSIRVSALQGNSMLEVVAQATGVTNEYEAQLAIEDFVNGSVILRCSASDTADMPRTNSDAIATYIDQGPQIDILIPDTDAAYANQLEVLFKVTPNVVSLDDSTGSTVNLNSVELSLSAVPIDNLIEVNGAFSRSIAFDDPIFEDPLLGEQALRVVAANNRGVFREQTVIFNVDNDGPVISITEPAAGEIVSKIMYMSVEVDDISGVEPTTVIATIAGVHEIQLNGVLGNTTYTGSFDTRNLDGMVFPTIVVRAKDFLGNQSSFGQVATVDNAPPLISLDSPRIREGNPTVGGVECSRLYDPLGDDAVNDGQLIAQLSAIRVRVEDRPNTGTQSSGIYLPRARVNLESVDLFILDDVSRPLIVDTDGDDICDEINPHLVPTSVPMADNEVGRIDLAPVPPAGASNFSTPIVPYAGGPPADDFCIDPGDGFPPSAMCFLQSELTRATPTIFGDPAIFTIPPVFSSDGGQCLGNAFDSIGTNISDGWVCISVRALDNEGNLNVSPPLRVCIDADGNGAECSGGEMPDCSGTYDPMADTVDADDDCYLPANDYYTEYEVRIPL